MFSDLLFRMRALFRRGSAEAELGEELRAHLERQTEKYIQAGLPQYEAARRARIDLGGVEQVKEECRDARGVRFIETLVQDVRYGLRQLRRNRGFTAVAIITLAFGIGANTAIFSIVDSAFLRPLSFPHADRICVVDRIDNPIGGHSISMPIYLAWQKQREIFDHLALVGGSGTSFLSADAGPEAVLTAGATPGLFSVLGVHPALGRGFLPEESKPGSENAAILSDSLWRSRFGAKRNILGTVITLDERPYTVVGVLPRGFQLPIPYMRNAGIWLPIHVPLTSNNPSNGDLLCLGLLKRNVTPAEAAAALTPALAALRTRFPKMFGPNEKAHLDPLHSFLADWAGPAPLLLFGAVGLVLLLAAVNVANLALARAATRRREIAIRTAIGARRRRIVRQLLTESVLLALIGGTLGVFLCYAGFDSIVALVPANLPHVGAYQIDGTVLAFALALSFATGIVFGLAPSLASTRVDLSHSLKEADSLASATGRATLQSVLAAGELAISLVVLIGAALALESFAGLMRVRPGFDASHLLTFGVSLPQNKYADAAQRRAFFDRALERLQAMPGVKNAALANILPLEGGGDILFSIAGGAATRAPGRVGDADYRVVTPGFFDTMRIPLMRGRAFSDSDNGGSELVVIVSEAMAKMYWPDQDPIGRRIWVGKPMGPAFTEARPREIVGVVGSVRESSLASAPDPAMYIPFSQAPSWDPTPRNGSFVVRTRGTPLALIPEVRAAFRALDTQLPLTDVQTMKEVVSSSLGSWRFRAILLTSFAGLALLIAAIGTYGVMSYAVSRKTHEIGIRMALGAQKTDVLRLVVRQGMIPALIGVSVGLGAALALTRLLASMLYGVKPTDPLTFIAVSLILLGVAVLACYIPARRATRIDPMVALRYE